jgi:hypothetical protein
MTSSISNKPFEFKRLEGRSDRGVYKEAFDRRIDKAVNEIHRTAMDPEAINEVHQEVKKKVKKVHQKEVKKINQEVINSKALEKIHCRGDAYIQSNRVSENSSGIGNPKEVSGHFPVGEEQREMQGRMDEAIQKLENANEVINEKQRVEIDASKKRCNMICGYYMSSINSNYNEYMNLEYHPNFQHEKNKENFQNLQKSKRKELLNDIGVLRKLFTDELSNLESSVNGCFLFNLFNAFPSVFENEFLISFFKLVHGDKVSYINLILNIRDKVKFINRIESDILTKHNKYALKGAENVVNRIELFLSNHVNDVNKNIDPDINKLLNDNNLLKEDSKIKFSDFDKIQLKNKLELICSKKESGVIKLSDEFDLIVTEKNNYYISVKSKAIGHGTEKIVYKGLDLLTNKSVAILYVNSRYLTGARKEEKISVKLKGSKGIVKTKDYLKSDDVGIFISDLYKKSDLSKNLNNEELLKNKHRFSKKVIDALRSCIEKGILLSDFKPQNVLLDDDYNPYLSDLGEHASTPRYAPPELSINEKITEKGVVWSLGMSLFEVYCGCHFLEKFYSKMHNQEIKLGQWSTVIHVNNLLEDDITAFFEFKKQENPADAEFLDIIRSMLHKSPEERPNLRQISDLWKEKLPRHEEENALIE